MNRKIVQRFKYNEQLKQWEIITSDPEFVQMSPEDLVSLYKMDPEFRRNVIKTAETLREALIEEALEKSDYSDAKEIIGWIKNGRQNT